MIVFNIGYNIGRKSRTDRIIFVKEPTEVEVENGYVKKSNSNSGDINLFLDLINSKN